MTNSKHLVEITSEDLEYLRARHEEKRKELLAKLQEEESVLAQLTGKAASNQMPLSLNTNGYSRTWQLPKKIAFIIKEFNHCVPVGAILERLSELEPGLFRDADEKRKTSVYVYSSVGTKIKKGVDLNRYSEGDEGPYKIGLIEWFNSDGTPKDEYR